MYSLPLFGPKEPRLEYQFREDAVGLPARTLDEEIKRIYHKYSYVSPLSGVRALRGNTISSHISIFELPTEVEPLIDFILYLRWKAYGNNKIGYPDLKFENKYHEALYFLRDFYPNLPYLRTLLEEDLWIQIRHKEESKWTPGQVLGCLLAIILFIAGFIFLVNLP